MSLRSRREHVGLVCVGRNLKSGNLHPAPMDDGNRIQVMTQSVNARVTLRRRGFELLDSPKIGL